MLRDVSQNLTVSQENMGPTRKSALRVIIDARLMRRGFEGSIEQVLIGLLRGLGELECEATYSLACSADAPDILRQYLGRNQQLTPWPSEPISIGERFKRSLGSLRRPLGRWLRAALRRRASAPQPIHIPESNGFLE